MSEVLRELGRWWHGQDQEHEHAPAVVIYGLALQAPGKGPRSWKLCLDSAQTCHPGKTGGPHMISLISPSSKILSLHWSGALCPGRAEPRDRSRLALLLDVFYVSSSSSCRGRVKSHQDEHCWTFILRGLTQAVSPAEHVAWIYVSSYSKEFTLALVFCWK